MDSSVFMGAQFIHFLSSRDLSSTAKDVMNVVYSH